MKVKVQAGRPLQKEAKNQTGVRNIVVRKYISVVIGKSISYRQMPNNNQYKNESAYIRKSAPLETASGALMKVEYLNK